MCVVLISLCKHLLETKTVLMLLHMGICHTSITNLITSNWHYSVVRFKNWNKRYDMCNYGWHTYYCSYISLTDLYDKPCVYVVETNPRHIGSLILHFIKTCSTTTREKTHNYSVTALAVYVFFRINRSSLQMSG